MCGRICLRYGAPVRVTEQLKPLLVQVPAQLLHVGDVIVDLISA